MKNTLKIFTIICLSLFVLQAQDITNKLGGDTNSASYKITDSNDNVLFEVYGDGDVGVGVYPGDGRLQVDESVHGTAAIKANHTGNYCAIFGESNGTTGTGVRGKSDENNGVYGSSTNGEGVFGSTFTSNGVSGHSYGSGDGVHGSSGTGDGVIGWSTSGAGVYGNSTSSYGVYGSSNTGYAGYFQGQVHVTGALTKGAGSFKIDHPLDPANKYLYHSFVESPDMMNIYNGTVILDSNGNSVVEMPYYFETLNRDFRYQLTCIGGFAQVYIAEEISENTFKIAGGIPGLKVSWQVTGVRQDPYAVQNPIIVEEDKTGAEIGKYLHPKAYGLPEAMGINRGNN